MEPWEVWNEILKRAGGSPSSLRADERTVYRVNKFLCDVEMGGLSGFLYNVSPIAGQRWSDLEETAGAVERIGHSDCAAALRNLAGLLEQHALHKAATWDAFLAPLADHLEAAVAPAIEAHLNELYEKLELFTIQHFS